MNEGLTKGRQAKKKKKREVEKGGKKRVSRESSHQGMFYHRLIGQWGSTFEGGAYVCVCSSSAQPVRNAHADRQYVGTYILKGFCQKMLKYPFPL